MKSFAFLDVDQTLLYDNSDINLTLLDALKNQGITDIFLFTNMDMKEIGRIGRELAPMSRYELINILQKNGFKIHGVITPADTGYCNDSMYSIGHAYEHLYKPSYERLKKNPLTDVKGNLNELRDIDDEVEYYLRKFEWDKASYITRERCKDELRELEITSPQLAIFYGHEKKYCANKEELKQLIMDCKQKKIRYEVRIDQNNNTHEKTLSIVTGGYTDNKALMMDMAIKELTKKHGDIGILFADDQIGHLRGAESAVKKFNEDSNNSSRIVLSTLEMEKSYPKAINEDSLKKYKATIASFNINISIEQLNIKREELSKKSVMKDDKYDIASKCAGECYTKLKALSDDHFINKKIDFPKFRLDSLTQINQAKTVLEQHRGCKQILGNIALAIAGLGIFYVLAGLVNLANTRKFLFFKTDSADKLDSIEKAIKNIQTTSP